MKAKYKILLVDNEMQRLADVYSKLLMKDYKVDVTVEWDQVLSRVKRFNPELIIIKSEMPKFDGTLLCQSIKTQYNIPIILLVDKDSPTALQINSCEADAVLEKPVNGPELLQMVEEFQMKAGQPDTGGDLQQNQ